MGLKFLITGGLGHIGSKLIREYAKRDDIELIRILDNFLVQRYCSLFNLPNGKKYEFIEGDIMNDSDLKKAMKDIDVMIHLASITDAPATIAKPEETERINFEGTKKVVNVASNSGVKKFLFPSSTSVYGEAEGIVDENFKDFKPSSPYATTKLASERFLQERAKTEKMEIIVLRMGTIFGTSVGMRFHTAINKFCYLAATNKPLTVWDSALNSRRPYLGLNDDIRAFEFLEKHGKSGEIYNVVTKNYSMQDIIDAIKEFVPNLKIEITKSPLLNQKPYHASNEKIIKLGFEFKDDLRQSMKETLELFGKVSYSGIDNRELNKSD
ncbi:NAD(P)-dependent oxidoreductase [Candidatus Pacearchaeota archaeon]|nr:NAD(P)-dependent oxidoreductase [Candidatus Pacearchaeota archaeon]